MPDKMTQAEINEITTTFDRDGVAVIPGVITASECQTIRDVTDRLLDAYVASTGVTGFGKTSVMRSCVERDAIFRDMLVREPLLSLAQAVLGENCRYFGSIVIRNRPNTAIDFWHIDLLNHVQFPLPDDIPHHDFRIRMPVNWMTIQVALSDIETLEYGPTQYVPGSHYSGQGRASLAWSRRHSSDRGLATLPVAWGISICSTIRSGIVARLTSRTAPDISYGANTARIGSPAASMACTRWSRSI